LPDKGLENVPHQVIQPHARFLGDPFQICVQRVGDAVRMARIFAIVGWGCLFAFCGRKKIIQ
jgi:hypothetical protein